jgi:hypothetical protein
VHLDGDGLVDARTAYLPELEVEAKT